MPFLLPAVGACHFLQVSGVLGGQEQEADMAELKTQENDISVDDFLAGVEHKKRREDSFVVKEILERLTGEPAKMWGSSIVGFGTYEYKYPSGRSGRWMMGGFSPRKAALTLYIMPGFSQYEELLLKLGKHKTGKSCLYINKLEDVDRDVLEQLITLSFDHMKEKYAVS